MFEKITPEEAGISSANVLKFMKTLDEAGLATHSVIMARGDKIFHECYYAPINKDFKHRMYSVSKSFVSVAIGLLIEDGLLHFEDKLCNFFEEYCSNVEDASLKELTIGDMLVMETGCSDPIDWFHTGTKDRCEVYFKTEQNKVCGTIFDYDSPGSFMLGCIVEKLTKKPFLKFMQERFLDAIGFSKDAYCLQAPGGHSFSDSGVMCTARDLLLFARFVMNLGTWNQKRYMGEDYLKAATAKQADNNFLAVKNFNTYGYGYQIWIGKDDTFFFDGMGNQYAICDRKKDFVFVINSDNQGNDAAPHLIHTALQKYILSELNVSLPDDKKANTELSSYCSNLKLRCLMEGNCNNIQKKISGITYCLEKNPMQIKKLRFDFNGKKAVMTYTNATGEKKLMFGIGYNEFSKFPEEGYSDMVATVYEPGHFYDCAASGAWVESSKLLIKVQIIDKYFGNAAFTISFKDQCLTLRMTKTAEAFLEEYCGTAVGKIQS